MKRIGLLSDTHGFLDQSLLKHFDSCDEIWHAGDIGQVALIEVLENFRPVRMVYGNIDGQDVRLRTQENLHFAVEGLRVWMTHIGGYPPRYNPAVKKALKADPPDLFICGHSHVLRVMRDPGNHNLLYINPGAAGIEGFHRMRTAIRFELDHGSIRNMEVIELGKRGAMPVAPA